MDNKGYRINKSPAGQVLIIACCLLFFACCLLISCGRKGDPTLKSYEKPEAPSGFRAIHRESDILLLWNFPKGKEQEIKGFQLLKSSGGPSADFEKISFIEPGKRSYTDTNFKAGTEYNYKIISLSLKDVMSKEDLIKVIPQTPPPPPKNFSLRMEDSSLILKWESAGEKVSFNIYKTKEKGKYGLSPLNREPVRETSFKDTLDIKNPVSYTIRSSTGSDIRDEGPPSEEITVNPADFVPSRIEGLHAVAKEDDVYLIWKESPEIWVAGYRVYRETNREEGYKLIGETPIPSFIDREKPSTERNYRVTAIGPSKEGEPAEIRDIVFVPQR